MKIAIAATLCSVPIAAIKGYQAYFIKNVIDGIFAPDATLAYALELAAILAMLGIISYPLRYIHFYGIRYVVDHATCDLRRVIYTKFQHLSASYYSQAKQGQLLSIMINDTVLFAESFMHSLALIREPISALALISVAFYHDWRLTLIILVVVPFFMLVFLITGKRIRKYIARAQGDTADMTHHAAEGLMGQKIIKAFNLQNYMVKRFDTAQKSFLHHKLKSNSAEEHSHPMVELVGAFAFSLVIILAFYRSRSGLSVGEFISFIGALAMFMDPVRRFSKSNTKLNQARAAAQRIFKLVNETQEIDTGKKKLKSFNDKIEFKNVSFSYEDYLVIKNLDLTIHKGEKVALVGLSGSGKSTLVSLLLRLYPIDQGEILLDGVNINEFELEKYRDKLALVSQDIFLFNDTMIENLKSGKDYSQEQIEQALKVSYVDDFLKTMPEGLNTVIGDRGLKLSGGQSQRLTIARAFLRDCPIMLFDEATSALDNESEQVVQKALDQVASHKTVIAIAHRLSTISHYDKIVVLKDGQKVEEGSHQDLINLSGEYKKLYDLTERA